MSQLLSTSHKLVEIPLDQLDILQSARYGACLALVWDEAPNETGHSLYDILLIHKQGEVYVRLLRCLEDRFPERAHYANAMDNRKEIRIFFEDRNMMLEFKLVWHENY